MTRIEAAAKAIYKHNNSNPQFDYPADEFDCCAAEAIQAADSFDAANGVHRVSLDEETVERAAQANDPHVWDENYEWLDDTRPIAQQNSLARTRRILAAAVKEDQ